MLRLNNRRTRLGLGHRGWCRRRAAAERKEQCKAWQYPFHLHVQNVKLSSKRGWRGSCVFAGTMTDAIVCSNDLFPDHSTATFDSQIAFSSTHSLWLSHIPVSSRRRLAGGDPLSDSPFVSAPTPLSCANGESRRRRLRPQPCGLSNRPGLPPPAACAAVGDSINQIDAVKPAALSNFPKVCSGNDSPHVSARMRR